MTVTGPKIGKTNTCNNLLSSRLAASSISAVALARIVKKSAGQRVEVAIEILNCWGRK